MYHFYVPSFTLAFFLTFHFLQILFVSANVHDLCFCSVDGINLDSATTQSACDVYSGRFYVFNHKKPIDETEDTSIQLRINEDNGMCGSVEKAPQGGEQYGKHLGGDEMQLACEIAAVLVGNAGSIKSVCPKGDASTKK